MARANKQKATFTLMPENMEWMRGLSDKTGVSMSMFIDSLITGVRVTVDQGISEREAMSIAFEQIAKGLKR